MITEKFTINYNEAYDYGFRYFDTFLGCKVAFSTYEGETLIGTIAEDKTGFGRKFDYIDADGRETHIRLVIKFDDGKWAMLPAILDIIQK